MWAPAVSTIPFPSHPTNILPSRLVVPLAALNDTARPPTVHVYAAFCQERMGPGGLDPVEVFPTLPKDMQIAFETKDTPLLKKALLALTEEERK